MKHYEIILICDMADIFHYPKDDEYKFDIKYNFYSNGYLFYMANLTDEELFLLKLKYGNITIILFDPTKTNHQKLKDCNLI